MKRITCLLPALCCLPAGIRHVPEDHPPAVPGDVDEESPTVAAATVVIDNPYPKKGACFGTSVGTLDQDGDGKLDLAVGADRQGAVYVMRGTGDASASGAFQEFVAFNATGVVEGPPPRHDDQFGFCVAAGQLDGDAAEELVIGAPTLTVGGVTSSGGVFVVGLGADQNAILRLAVPSGSTSRLGNSVAVGDFNGDGKDDIAAGAPQTIVGGVPAGVVLLWFGSVGAGDVEHVRLANPAPVANGNFGHVVTAGGANPSQPGEDLFVSALGNTSRGVSIAGEVYVWRAPFDPAVIARALDPAPLEGDPARFGMHIAARDGHLAVGAPRKDAAGVLDAGMGFGFRGPSWRAATLYPHPTQQAKDVHGFRVVLADLVGDAGLDFAVGSLPTSLGAEPNDLRVWVWDGAGAEATPTSFAALPDAGDHWIQGISTAQLVAGGKEELITGDPTFDRPGKPANDDSGRVVIYAVE